MADSIPVLWPENISVKIVSPLAILGAQVGPLKSMTGGLLSAEISTALDDARSLLVHRMDLVAIALQDFRVGILKVTHGRAQVYPATIIDRQTEETGSDGCLVDSEDEFIKALRKVLRSAEIRSIIDSLLAQINESVSKESIVAAPTPARRRAHRPGKGSHAQ